MARPNRAITCNVKRYRQAKGWSQQELAEKIEVRRQAIYDIESGRYLPNTAIALQLAHTFDCRVEDLFVAQKQTVRQPVHVINGIQAPATRLALGHVRNRLVGISLQGVECIPFGLRPADGVLSEDAKSAEIFSSADRLGKTIILMGCDPAFEILSHHVSRHCADARVFCQFASSHRALCGLADGLSHVAGTHLHNTDDQESNVAAAGQMLRGTNSLVIGFSVLEEGLMVAKGNPLDIRSAADLAQPMVHFVNREPGAALRVLLDDHLHKAGVPRTAVNGYRNEVKSHREGAYRIVCNVADAALGLRAVAEAYDLGFVPIATARCDLVIPGDMRRHPTVKILQDVLQSSGLRKEIDAIGGYAATAMGKIIAEL